MLLKLPILLVCAAWCGAKVCEDVSIRNHVKYFEKYLRNCTQISGYLEIVLIEHAGAAEFANVSFPELTEITGYLMVYRVYGLTSLGLLFPNLTVIRGLSLFKDYSLVLYDVKDMEEIGLYNLRYIARGSTRIERCSRLCYVYSLDWTKIGNPYHELHYFNTTVEDEFCLGCPVHCNGYCWNYHHCQDMATHKCHSECLGCTAPHQDDKCIVCKSYNDSGKCVDGCPKNKYRHVSLASCVTTEECTHTPLYETWWIFNSECIKECPPHYMRPATREPRCDYCGDNCPKKCGGGEIDSMASAEAFRGCTYIEGSLSLRVNSKSTVDELAKNLGMIEEIEGYLKVYRSPALATLDFFKRLSVIHGLELYNNRYSVAAYDNQNLYKLWNWTGEGISLRAGSIMFHYNPQLCPTEIKEFANATNSDSSPPDVSPYSNGDKRACNYIDLNVTVVEIKSTNATLSWNKFVSKTNRTKLIGYFVYYIEDYFGNITIYDERDECEGNNWESIFVYEDAQQKRITNLNPYTQYAYYIKVYTNFSAEDGLTEIQRFKTLSGDPFELLDLRVVSTTSDSITLTWEPPIFTNGRLDSYKIAVYFERDDETFLANRNYCTHPHVAHLEAHQESSKEENNYWVNTSSSNCCNKPTEVSKKFDFTCVITMSNVESKECQNYRYNIDESLNYTDYMLIVPDMEHKLVKRELLPVNSSLLIEDTIEGLNQTQYVIDNLKHYSMHIVHIRGCNINEDEYSNETDNCGPPAMVSRRTLPKEDADDIPSELTIHVDHFSITVRWLEPKDPNALILAYQIEHKRTDLQHSKTLAECVTRLNFVAADNEFKIKNFLPGKYALRVKAISLAGPGRFTKYIGFEIELPSNGSSYVFIVMLIITLVLILSGLSFCYRYYYKSYDNSDQQRLISSGSSDYSGPYYVEDEWEMDRNDIEIVKEIGKGTFGMVYNGFIKSQNRSCAVKTINEQAGLHEKIVFLNEASVMKSFNNAHHVVKLLGVVSRGQPPLVVMELMARGDLKSFLRLSRNSSNHITCAEMYRMAAEVADGMMYLSAKKFVHRDLAARNCMVSADYTVKIGDFGMTRDIYETDYYRKESGGLMPIRWMSPESLADGVFTADSDVWSYGVLLWEMVTLGELPYQGLANEQVLQFVTAQGTLERPSECPDLLYEIMTACWKWNPNSRPLFSSIVEKLESHIGQHFRFVSFYHSAESEEYRVSSKDRGYNVPAMSSALSRDMAIYWNAFDDDINI